MTILTNTVISEIQMRRDRSAKNRAGTTTTTISVLDGVWEKNPNAVCYINIEVDTVACLFNSQRSMLEFYEGENPGTQFVLYTSWSRNVPSNGHGGPCAPGNVTAGPGLYDDSAASIREALEAVDRVVIEDFVDDEGRGMWRTTVWINGEVEMLQGCDLRGVWTKTSDVVLGEDGNLYLV